MTDVQGQPTQARPRQGNGQDEIQTLNEMANDCEAVAKALITFATNMRKRGDELSRKLEQTAESVLLVIGR